MHASALIRHVRRSVSQLALVLFAPSYPSVCRPGSSSGTLEDHQVDFYTAAMLKAELMLAAALPTVLLFIRNLVGLAYKCSVSFSLSWG